MNLYVILNIISVLPIYHSIDLCFKPLSSLIHRPKYTGKNWYSWIYCLVPVIILKSSVSFGFPKKLNARFKVLEQILIWEPSGTLKVTVWFFHFHLYLYLCWLFIISTSCTSQWGVNGCHAIVFIFVIIESFYTIFLGPSCMPG